MEGSNCVLQSFMRWSARFNQKGTRRGQDNKIYIFTGPRDKRHALPCKATWGECQGSQFNLADGGAEDTNAFTGESRWSTQTKDKQKA